ncbi:hypothetical protein HDU79_011447 [Rhizoclosmatium sp. JEL0117]|nr:hypothetical protein HDU79_011447 [Rhizoclosmatium sp. JEL0117]
MQTFPVSRDDRSLITSAKNIYVGTVGATASAAAVGGLWGIVAGQGPVGYAFLMGTNWLSLSLPFFVTREAILHQRQRLNPVYGRRNWRHRDGDEMLASTVAGSVVGGGLAYYTRGSLAVIGGGIMFGTLAAVGQYAATKFRHARQEAGYAIAKGEEKKEKRIDLRNQPEREPESFDDHGYDPLREFTQYLRRKVLDRMGDVTVTNGGWVSPMLNALDLDYRKRLNIKIEILERQVSSLKVQLEAKGIRVE